MQGFVSKSGHKPGSGITGSAPDPRTKETSHCRVDCKIKTGQDPPEKEETGAGREGDDRDAGEGRADLERRISPVRKGPQDQGARQCPAPLLWERKNRSDQAKGTIKARTGNVANRGEQSEMATTEIIIGYIAGGTVLLCLLYVIGMEIGERLCMSRGGRGRNCPRPYLCRREGRHIAKPPPYTPPPPPK